MLLGVETTLSPSPFSSCNTIHWEIYSQERRYDTAQNTRATYINHSRVPHELAREQEGRSEKGEEDLVAANLEDVPYDEICTCV